MKFFIRHHSSIILFTFSFKRIGQILTFSKEAYEERQIKIKRTVNAGILLLDCLTCIGVLVDLVTGAWYNLKPEQVNVRLTNLGSVDGPDNIEFVLKGNNEGVEVKSSVYGFNP